MKTGDTQTQREDGQMLIKAEITVILPQALGAIRSKEESLGGGGVGGGGSVALPTP